MIRSRIRTTISSNSKRCTMRHRAFSSTEELLQNYAEVRKRLYTERQKPPAPSPEKLLPILDEKPKPEGKAEVRAKVRQIAAAYGVASDSIFSHNASAAIAAARRAAMVAVAKMRPDWPVAEVARFFRRHHTTVLEAFRRAGYI